MDGEYITTTELREQSSKLVASLLLGEDVKLVHRSKIIGVIKPVKAKASPLKNLEQFGRELAAVRPASLVSRKDREKLYRKYMEKKHGKGIS